jgi:quinol monooxygenase YgiN
MPRTLATLLRKRLSLAILLGERYSISFEVIHEENMYKTGVGVDVHGHFNHGQRPRGAGERTAEATGVGGPVGENAAAKAAKESGAENGCKLYEFHRDLEKPTYYTLIEQWSGLAALREHLKQNHTKEIQTAMTEMSTTPRTTEIFAASVER